MSLCNYPVERRLYTRVKKTIPIHIYYDNQHVSTCSTNNISIGGALLSIDNIGLTENALITTSFEVNPWHPLHQVRIPSIVVRCNKTHIAIAFERLHKDTEDLMHIKPLHIIDH